jgi:HD superfamily phosphohydrolase
MLASSYDRESLVSDPLHGYIPFTAARAPGETAEAALIDHPWMQRLRRIHQLQSAWWVYPTAEHTRFQHVLGAMHMASRAVSHLYQSLVEACTPEPVPSRGYVESLVRLAALLHDVGHGPYGHFFDDQFLHQYQLTHEDLGQHIILQELGGLIRGVRANPHGQLADGETLDPEQIAWLIKRPSEPDAGVPRWLQLLRALFSGIYTVDNMDFVLRDSYMSGHGPRAFDLDRLLHYSFFTRQGLTLHARGLATLETFLEARGKLFQSLYFHRTVRAIDLTLKEVFKPTLNLLMPVNPLQDLPRYRRLTEWSLLADVERWPDDSDPKKQQLGAAWADILCRKVRWKMAHERNIRFEQGQSELTSIFTDPELVERAVRQQLPPALRGLEFRADVARHYHFPFSTVGARQNCYFEPATGQIRPLAAHAEVLHMPRSFSLCRLYARDHAHDADLANALDRLLQVRGDDKTNM